MTGTVKHWNAQRAYGFIRPDGNSGGDVFVHITALAGGRRELQRDERVQFNVKPGRNGEQAADVHVIG